MIIFAFLFFFLTILVKILNFAVFARILFSWLPQFNHEHHQFFAFLHDITEPLFRLVRVIPHRIGMMDISAIYVIFFLQIVASFLSYLASYFIV